MNRLLRKHIFKKIVKHSSATAMKSYGPELYVYIYRERGRDRQIDIDIDIDIKIKTKT